MSGERVELNEKQEEEEEEEEEAHGGVQSLNSKRDEGRARRHTTESVMRLHP